MQCIVENRQMRVCATFEQGHIVSINVNGLCGKSLHMQDLIFETSADIILC